MSPTSRPTVRFSPVGGNVKENINIIHNFDQYRKRTKLSKENSWSLAKQKKNHPTNRILVLIQYSANTSVEYIFKMKKHWKRKRSSHQDSPPTSLPLPWEGLSAFPKEISNIKKTHSDLEDCHQGDKNYDHEKTDE